MGIEEDFYASGCVTHDPFTRYFVEDATLDESRGHYLVHLHSNGLCYLALAPTHPLNHFEIQSVEYVAQRLQNKVSGKRKRGSQLIHSSTHLCSITTAAKDGGKSYKIRSCVEGKLLEINTRLLTNPQEVKNPLRGYLAIFETKFVAEEGGVPGVPSSWVEEKQYFLSPTSESSL